jgi:hypothetical protein
MQAQIRDMEGQIDITSFLKHSKPSTHSSSHLDNSAEHEPSIVVVGKKFAA